MLFGFKMLGSVSLIMWIVFGCAECVELFARPAFSLYDTALKSLENIEPMKPKIACSAGTGSTKRAIMAKIKSTKSHFNSPTYATFTSCSACPLSSLLLLLEGRKMS